MSIRFRLLTEADVKAVLTMDDLIETMTSALQRFSAGRVAQPIRTVIPVQDTAFFGLMPAFVRGDGGANSDSGVGGSPVSATALGAKLVTVFGSNEARGLPTHLASIVLLDPETGALLSILDGRYITEARTAAVSAVSSRLLARTAASSLAIIGSGVQARSHLEALSRIHTLRQVVVWSPHKLHRDRFVEDAREHAGDGLQTASPPGVPARAGHPGGGLKAVPYRITAVDHAGEAVVGADVIVLATSSPTPVLEDGWVKPGAHVISVGACRPTQREMDPALVARARLFVDSRGAALVESGDVVLGIEEGRFRADHIVAELGELVVDDRITRAPHVQGRRSDADITIFKSLGLAVEDVTAADLAYRRAIERGVGQLLAL